MAKINILMAKHNGRCQFCGCTCFIATPANPFHATVDHDIPKARGGNNDPMNLVLACVRCNTAKGDMTGQEFRHFLRSFKLPDSYAEYLAERIKKLYAGRAPIVIHEQAKRNAAKQFSAAAKDIREAI